MLTLAELFCYVTSPNEIDNKPLSSLDKYTKCKMNFGWAKLFEIQ
jgi:hypothetical protein